MKNIMKKIVFLILFIALTNNLNIIYSYGQNNLDLEEQPEDSVQYYDQYGEAIEYLQTESTHKNRHLYVLCQDIFYRFNENGMLVSEVGASINGNDRVEYVHNYIYDEDGLISEMLAYDYLEPYYSGPYYYEIYEYENSYMTKKVTYSYDDSNECVYISVEEEYDGNGNTIKRIKYDSEGLVKGVYEYDVLGRTAGEYYYDSDGNISEKSIYIYDVNGEIERSESYNSDGMLSGWITYMRDANNEIIQSETYNSDGTINEWCSYVNEYYSDSNSLKSRWTYEYNSDGVLENAVYKEVDTYGRLIKSINYDPENDPDLKNGICTTRIYDDSGRIINMVSYLENGETDSILGYEYQSVQEYLSQNENNWNIMEDMPSEYYKVYYTNDILDGSITASIRCEYNGDNVWEYSNFPFIIEIGIYNEKFYFVAYNQVFYVDLITGELKIPYHVGMSGPSESGQYTLSCRRGGDTIWEYVSAEGHDLTVIGSHNDRYYFWENGEIIVLDLETGSVIWTWDVISEFAPYAATFGEDDTLYISGFDTPQFLEFDKNGNLVNKIESFGTNYESPYYLKYKNGEVKITFGNILYPENSLIINTSDGRIYEG